MTHFIDTYIISGFLGSGKTSVLKRLVADCKRRGQQVGVILNELGDTNVENHLFEREKMVELLNGCICCSIQDDLKLTLNQFIDDPVDVLFIEGTGVANPNEIVEAIASPIYIDHFSIKSIISLVDASQYLDYQSIFSSSKEIRTLLKEQITCASVVILNKTDLISEKKLDKIITSIQKNSSTDTPIFTSTFGMVDIDELLKPRIQTMNLSKQGNELSCGCQSNKDCSHTHSHQHATLKAVTFTDIPRFSKKAFEKWLKGLPKEVLRGKGIVEFAEGNARYSFQYASGQLQVEEIDSKQDSIIILIGDRLDQAALKEAFEQAFLNRLP